MVFEWLKVWDGWWRCGLGTRRPLRLSSGVRRGSLEPSKPKPPAWGDGCPSPQTPLGKGVVGGRRSVASHRWSEDQAGVLLSARRLEVEFCWGERCLVEVIGWGVECSFGGEDQEDAFDFPFEAGFGGVAGSGLGLFQSKRMGGEVVDGGGEGLGVVGGDEGSGGGDLVEDFPLSGGVGGDDGEARLEVLEEFVGDGQVAAGGGGLFQGEADVVVGDAGGEFVVGDGGVEVNAGEPVVGNLGGDPGLGVGGKGSSQVDFDGGFDVGEGGEQGFQAAPWADGLGKPVEANRAIAPLPHRSWPHGKHVIDHGGWCHLMGDRQGHR